MAGLRWFKVSTDLMRHKKSLALAGRLRDERAWSYVVQMWAWFCEQAGDGTQAGPDAAYLIARGSGWQGDADEFCHHMVGVGFLDTVPNGYRVHDWKEWAGAHVEYQKLDRARKAASRGCPPPCPPEVHRTSTGIPSERVVECLSTLSSRISGSGSVGGAGGDDAESRLAAFRVALGNRLVKPPEWFRLSSADNVPDTRTRLDAELVRLGVERAADVVAHRVREDGKVKQWLRYYLGTLADAMRDLPPAPVPSEPLPAPDPAFLDAHPGSREVWAEYEKNALSKATSEADKHRLLGTALFLFTNAYTEAA